MFRIDFKRITDLALTIPAMILLLPLFILLAGLVRLSLGRPVFFSQPRAGLRGKPFLLYKFRTMTDARDRDGRLLPDRERLTSLGKFLRRTSLDELPGLFNVIKGDLRLVGPRPLLIHYLPYYSEREQLRHSVKPGITGWAQIHGRNYLPWDERLALDVWYVENWSPWLDLRILVQTVAKVIAREGVSVDSYEVERELDQERMEKRASGTAAGGRASANDPPGTNTINAVSDSSAEGRKPAFSPWPVFSDDEIEAVLAVLKSGKVNYWTGEEGRLFEQKFAQFVGTRHGIALANGTVALELALYVLGIGPGDEVITTSRTFIASASAIVMRGATPVIADVDRDSQNITAETIAAVLSDKTRAIIVVHLAGWPCEMDPIIELARAHDLKVIEDCAQAHGATYKGQRVGSIGDIGAFSFCQDKIMTTGGEGGMLTTNDTSLWERAWAFKDHGKSYRAVFDRHHPPGFRWLHESFGTNWRMTEMQAALGRVMIKKLPDWLAVRQRNAALLNENLRQVPGLRICEPPPHVGHAYYKYYVFVRPERLKHSWNRDRILEAIAAEGVPCFSGSCSEIYLEKAFAGTGWRPPKRLPVARELGETSLMFLVHPTLDEAEILYSCQVINQVMRVAQRL